MGLSLELHQLMFSTAQPPITTAPPSHPRPQKRKKKKHPPLQTPYPPHPQTTLLRHPLTPEPPNPTNQPQIRCAYTQTCTTTTPGQQQDYRKLISHIFGRNKHSTKQIPAGLWCCYCRKHYQRARYWERDTWALRQCFWVEQMLWRLRSLPDIVGFQVQLRLRQQQQHAQNQNQNQTAGNNKPVVPGWLVDRITARHDEVWSFQETQDLVDREIRRWLLQLRARNVAAGEFPDVEILPVWR